MQVEELRDWMGQLLSVQDVGNSVVQDAAAVTGDNSHLHSTANTFRAPARAANMERIPVPHPTSKTTLSLNK